jgi:FkbH-like protein
MSAEGWLARAAWQPVIFAERLRRADLLALTPSWPLRSFRLTVLRNHAFEFVESVLRPFLAYAGWEAQTSYSDYDDSISLPAGPDADVIVLWIDFERFRLSADQLAGWMQERLTSLRRGSAAPILISDWPTDSQAAIGFNRALRGIADQLPGVYVADQAGIARALGEAYIDRRSARVAGMALSDAACLMTARQLGLGWLPAILEPGVKALAIDFDGTLYTGVLGEDGPGGLTVTAAHLELQRQLLVLRDLGIFLAGVTRNHPADIDRLFAERPDLALKREHFSSLVASWDEKADSLRQVARELRIDPDAFLFIDDNPGELASVAAAWPGMPCLHAAEPDLVARALRCYPGLMRVKATAADQLRLKDLAAAAARDQSLRQHDDPQAYLRSLDIELSFAVDARDQRQRLHELSTKTNQFNTALLRLSPLDVARYLREPGRHVVSIALRDRLSDSGLIGAVFTRLEGDRLMVDEVDISCRALGRSLERVMVMEAVRRGIGADPVTAVTFAFRSGPRNAPARLFLEALAGPVPDTSGAVSITWDASAVDRLLAATPVRVRHDQAAERAA